jgi:hypothetical protein
MRMDLRETGSGDADWIRLAQDRDRWRAVVNALLYFWVLVLQSYFFLSFFLSFFTYVKLRLCHVSKTSSW